MIFTIWQFLRNQEAEKARNQEREELLALLREERERERNAALTAQVLELTEPSSNRANGRDANDGEENHTRE